MSETHPPEQSNGDLLSRYPALDMQSQFHLQERRAHDAERLAAAAGIISASLDLKVTLEKVAEQAAHLLHVERAGVYLLDERDKIIAMHVLSTQQPSRLEKPHTLAALLKNAGAVALVQERGEPVIIGDVLTSTLLPATFIQQTSIRSIMVLPLVTARGVTGFITVSRSIPYDWTIENIRLGLAFATQSATAIENARLFDTLQQHNRHIETLNAIARLLSTLPDPGQHLDLVLQHITEILNLDSGMIFLLDQSKDELTLAAHCRLVEGVQLDLDAFPLKTLHMLARRVVDVREPLMFCADGCDELAVRNALHLVGFVSSSKLMVKQQERYFEHHLYQVVNWQVMEVSTFQ